MPGRSGGSGNVGDASDGIRGGNGGTAPLSAIVVAAGFPSALMCQDPHGAEAMQTAGDSRADAVPAGWRRRHSIGGGSGAG